MGSADGHDILYDARFASVVSLFSPNLLTGLPTGTFIFFSGASLDEENWLSQYGQVQSEDDGAVAFRSVDLWDWAMVTETIKRNKRGKKKKLKIDRLVGRLVRPSTTLHPSMPSGGCILKTTAIREVHLSLVRVSSGQVYRLKSPSLKYLDSISIYDASDPTKDWGFPHLAVDEQNLHLSKYPCGTLDGISAREVLSVLPDQLRISEKHKIRGYRDRAAERRAFHGGFGVGPGQKNSADDVETTSSVSYSTDKAAAEALNMSFGAGSYARRMLENMGWKEGEALGSCTKGLVEPLNAVSNKGFAGLGWEQHHRS
ncbi:hypothetical protein GIB67_030739 [Kingdonia uniflora]|uniref:G-patch domain-containing protein n=1 Tax=Kingdonia uniflora TaxID=39325 RepID=A0A7J7L2X8_9MAGN|nr:hypothetical protein GIB67_030739 [Kingdonia uniflora]